MAATHPSAFGALLRRYRIAAGLTQEELAERARLSVRAVSDLERGARRSPYRETVQQLADALDLGADEGATLRAAARHPGDSAGPDAEPGQASSVPTNLTPEPTSFIGREREMATVSALLKEPATRLVTLTGPGGIGKTRLARHVAAHLLDAQRGDETNRYPDGVFFVSLASIGEPALVPSAVIGALGLTERGGQNSAEALVEQLQALRLLLVLDNFEHLLDARSFLGDLLEACPSLHFLVTSREVLHLSWERAYEVPPLGLPDFSGEVKAGALSGSEAVALFVDRAQAVKADFTMTEENAAALAQICRHLEGMPLAIELAAARLRLFPPQALLGRLAQRLQFLTGGPHDLPARHQTLRAAIDWSYSLLGEEEKRLFARLSVFRGGCTLDAVEAVCNPAGDLGGDVLNGVASLVEKSLLRQDGAQEPRFVMLETIRDYAAEWLESARASEEFRSAHARWYLALAEEAATGLEGTEQPVWLERLEVERGNLHDALQWAGDAGEADLGLRLAIALSGFWMVRGPLSEGRRWLDEFVVAGQGAKALHAAALLAAGKLAAVEGHRRHAADLFEQSMALYREMDDRKGVADTMELVAFSWYMAGEIQRADSLMRQSEIEGRDTGNELLLATALRLQAMVETVDIEKIQRLGEESLALFRGLENTAGTARVLVELVAAAYRAADVQRARALTDDLLAILRRLPVYPEWAGYLERLAYESRNVGDSTYAAHFVEELMARAEAVGDRRAAAHHRVGLGLLAREKGDYRQATLLCSESLRVFLEVGDVHGRCRALVGLSDIARDAGDADRVIELCEEALTLLGQAEDVMLNGYALHNLGLAAWYQGEHARAEMLFAESLRLLGWQSGNLIALEVRLSEGLLALDRADYDLAAGILAECGVVAQKISQWLLGTVLEGMAGVAAGTGQAERAAQLFGTAATVRQTIGVPRWPALQSFYDRHVALARTALGEERFHAIVEGAGALPLEEAVSLALHE